jgi:hypothetical protein
MSKYNSDLLDDFCEEEFGHKDWTMDWDKNKNLIIKFYKKPRPEYLEELEEEEEEE